MKKLILLFLVAFACPLFAQLDDAENCKDSPVLSRMKGCWIYDCAKKDFDQAQLRIDRYDEKKQNVEGEYTRIEYDCPENISEIMVTRNAQNALKAAGFTTVYSGGGSDDHPALTARKGGLWVSIETGLTGRPGYTLFIVKEEAMEQQMIADAAAMEAEINSSGYCSIYGVLFDTGKATIQPESAKCLTEVATLLKKNATWKMQIEGHTDNVGAKDANLKLSQSRAEAVRSWLVTNGIEGARLTAKGFGDAKPKMENTTEDGRSKNRRVDLRKL